MSAHLSIPKVMLAIVRRDLSLALRRKNDSYLPCFSLSW